MPIITNPVIQKNQKNQFSLSKLDLYNNSKVKADSYFNDPNKWESVVVSYKSSTGNQYKNLIFKASDTEPKYNLFISEDSHDNFEVQNVVIMDKDNGYLKLYRTDLNVSDFDFSINM